MKNQFIKLTDKDTQLEKSLLLLKEKIEDMDSESDEVDSTPRIY